MRYLYERVYVKDKELNGLFVSQISVHDEKNNNDSKLLQSKKNFVLQF